MQEFMSRDNYGYYICNVRFCSTFPITIDLNKNIQLKIQYQFLWDLFYVKMRLKSTIDRRLKSIECKYYLYIYYY